MVRKESSYRKAVFLPRLGPWLYLNRYACIIDRGKYLTTFYSCISYVVLGIRKTIILLKTEGVWFTHRCNKRGTLHSVGFRKNITHETASILKWQSSLCFAFCRSSIFLLPSWLVWLICCLSAQVACDSLSYNAFWLLILEIYSDYFLIYNDL